MCLFRFGVYRWVNIVGFEQDIVVSKVIIYLLYYQLIKYSYDIVLYLNWKNWFN